MNTIQEIARILGFTALEPLETANHEIFLASLEKVMEGEEYKKILERCQKKTITPQEGWEQMITLVIKFMTSALSTTEE